MGPPTCTPNTTQYSVLNKCNKKHLFHILTIQKMETCRVTGKATKLWVICAAAHRENHHPRMSLLKIRPLFFSYLKANLPVFNGEFRRFM